MSDRTLLTHHEKWHSNTRNMHGCMPSKTLLCLHIGIKPFIHVCTKSIPAPRSQWAGSQNGGYFDLQHCSCLFWKDSFITFFSLTQNVYNNVQVQQKVVVVCASLFFIYIFTLWEPEDKSSPNSIYTSHFLTIYLSSYCIMHKEIRSHAQL